MSAGIAKSEKVDGLVWRGPDWPGGVLASDRRSRGPHATLKYSSS